MPVLWSKLQIEIADALINQKLTGAEASAEFFTESYVEAVALAQDPKGNFVVLSKKKKILYKGWLKAFKMMEASPIDLKMIPYLHVSKALVKYWTLMPVTWSMPHPPGTVGTLNGVVFPGNVVSVSPGIWKAFNKKKELLVAAALVDVFKKHLKSVKGIWFGLRPGESGLVPVPFVAWSGLK